MGRDPGWQFGNMGNRKGGSGLGTYAAGSDARLPGSWDLHKEVEMDIDRLREERCESSTPTVPSPHNIPGMHGFNHQDEGYYSLSGTSISQSVFFQSIVSSSSSSSSASVPPIIIMVKYEVVSLQSDALCSASHERSRIISP